MNTFSLESQCVLHALAPAGGAADRFGRFLDAQRAHYFLNLRMSFRVEIRNLFLVAIRRVVKSRPA